MNEWNDSELREALRRREARRPRTEVTEDFVNDVMREIEAREHHRRQEASVKRHLWRIALAALAAAASIVLVVIWTWPVTQSDTSNQIIGHVQLVNRTRRVAQSDTSNRSNGQSSHSIGHVQNKFGQVQLGNRTKLLTKYTRTVTQSDTSNWSNGQSSYSIGYVQNNFGHVQLVNRTKLLTNSTRTNRQPYKYKPSSGQVQSVNQTRPISQLTRNFQPTHAQLSTNSHVTLSQPTTSDRKDAPDDFVAQMESELADVRDSCYLAQVERMIADNEELQRMMDEMTNHKQ